MSQSPQRDPKPGDVLRVQLRPGHMNGRKSRAGILFTEGSEVTIAVGNGVGQVDVVRAKAIVEDDALIVTDHSTTKAP